MAVAQKHIVVDGVILDDLDGVTCDAGQGPDLLTVRDGATGLKLKFTTLDERRQNLKGRTVLNQVVALLDRAQNLVVVLTNNCTGRGLDEFSVNLGEGVLDANLPVESRLSQSFVYGRGGGQFLAEARCANVEC